MGEKRPREEDPQDEQQPSRDPPRSISSFGTPSAQDAANFIDGPEEQMLPVVPVVSPADNPEGHDALYIGDLQWVR